MRNGEVIFRSGLTQTRAAQLQKMAKGLKFQIKQIKGLCYVYENKGADQLHSCHAVDLHLCFRISKEQVFS